LAAKRWTPEQRERLGAQLTERREELDPRYYTREVFAAERGINLRMAADLEKGRPRNFTPLTLRDTVAPAYQVTYESVLDAADGGRLVAVPGSPPVSAATPSSPAIPGSGDSRTGPMLGMIADAAPDDDVAPFLKQVRTELAAAFAEYGPEFTGSQAFTARHEIDTWDNPRLGGAEKERLIATLRLFRSEGTGAEPARTGLRRA
jgi:hypothetical protein